MKTKTILAFAVCMLAAMACVEARPPQDPRDVTVVTTIVDPTMPPEELAAVPVCVRACKRLAKLECPEGARPDGGDGCYPLCERLEKGRNFSMNPGCVAGAEDVPAVRMCGVRCRGR